MRRLILCIGLVLLLTAPLAAQEVIGPWDVRAAPASATGVVSDPTGWLHVVNSPVDVNEAFSGFSIIDDGWANIAPGNYIVVTFAPAIPNIAGPDLVLFDGHYDEGTYAVSTDYDGFTATVGAGPGADSGVDRSYYYDGAGPYGADIFGMEIDLSNLGVPADATVSSIRFEATNDSCDPIGIGALADPIPVELMTFTVD